MSGAEYTGEFKNNYVDGKGTFKDSTGTIVEGELKREYAQGKQY